MELFTKEQREKLLDNYRKSSATAGSGNEFKPEPVVKWFTPDGNITWLISELDTENEDIAYGVADLGFGEVEYGSIYVPEVKALRGKFRLPVERDLHFRAKGNIYEYLRLGSQLGSLMKAISAINSRGSD